MPVDPKLDRQFCELIAEVGALRDGFIDFDLVPKAWMPEVTEARSLFEIYGDAKNLFAIIHQDEGHDPRYVNRVRSFVHTLRLLLNDQHFSFSDSCFECLQLDDIGMIPDHLLEEEKRVVEGYLYNAGFGQSMADYNPYDPDALPEKYIDNIKDVERAYREVKEAHLPLMAAYFGEIPAFTDTCHQEYDPDVTWRCWLSGDGRDFKLKFNRYCDARYSHQRNLTFLHELTHMAEVAIKRRLIEEGQLPPSFGLTWATDPSQVPSEGLANTIGRFLDSDLTRQPSMQFAYALILLPCGYGTMPNLR